MGNHAPLSRGFTDLLVRDLAAAVAPRQPHYLIRTQPRASRQVRDRLLGYGFSPISLKFIPGFLFLRFHPAQRLQIGSIPGVHSIVGFASQPAPVDENELEALRRVADACLPVGPAPFPAPGRSCRLARGPLEGVRGIVMGQPDRPLIVLSLTLLQRSIAVAVEPDWVGPLSPATSRSLHSSGDS